MQTQWKVVLLILLVVAGTLAALVWRTQNLILEDKLNFVNDAATKQIAPVRKLVQMRMDDVKDKLIQFTLQRESTGAPNPQLLNTFQVISLVTSADNTTWNPLWLEKVSGLNPEGWPSGHEMTLLKSLPFAKVIDGEVTWVRKSDAKGKPVFAVMVSVEIRAPTPLAAPSGLPDSTNYPAVPTAKKGIVVGFTSESPIAFAVDDFKGSTSNVYVIDQQGFVAAHTDRASVGRTFAEDPIVQEIHQNPPRSGYGQFLDFNGQSVLGHYEPIEHTNLTVITTTSLATALDVQRSYLRVAGVVGLGSVIVALLLTLVLLRGSADDAKFNPDETVIRGPNVVPVLTPPLVKSALTEQLHNLSSLSTGNGTRLAKGVTDQVRSQISAILGHVQLAQSKSLDGEVKEHARAIEREARRAGEVIEKIMKLTETGAQELAPVSLNLLAEEVLGSVEKNFALKGIKIHKNLTTTETLQLDASQIQTALLNILTNAAEAMANRPIKDLHLSLTQEGPRAKLVIKDTGIGMTADVKQNVFEPFFRGAADSEHLGIGLAISKKILRENGANIEVESVVGEGSTFTLIFKPQSAVSTKANSPKIEGTVHALVAELPSLPIKPVHTPPPLTMANAVQEPLVMSASSVEVEIPTMSKMMPEMPVSFGDSGMPTFPPSFEPVQTSSNSLQAPELDFKIPNFQQPPPIETPSLAPPPLESQLVQPESITLDGRPPLDEKAAAMLPPIPGLSDLSLAPAIVFEDNKEEEAHAAAETEPVKEEAATELPEPVTHPVSHVDFLKEKVAASFSLSLEDLKPGMAPAPAKVRIPADPGTPVPELEENFVNLSGDDEADSFAAIEIKRDVKGSSTNTAIDFNFSDISEAAPQIQTTQKPNEHHPSDIKVKVRRPKLKG